MRTNNRTTLMKCPKCEEVATFTYFYQVPHDAPVVVENGKFFVDYQNADDNGGFENEEGTCHCKQCGSLVPLADIEVVEVQEAEKEAA